MSPRYNKSVTITKGAKVNFSRSGPSLSLKGDGYNVNLSKRGVKVTPQKSRSGASYSGAPRGGASYAGAPRGGRSYSSPSRSGYPAPPPPPLHFTVKMDEKGRTWVVDDRNREIEDSSILRKIKADPEYQRQKALLESQRQSDLTEMVQASQEENEKFLNIHKLAPVVDTAKDFEKELSSLKCEKYVREVFGEPEPDTAAIRARLEEEAREEVKGFFLTIGKQRQEYVETNLPSRISLAQLDWQRKKDAFEAEQDKIEEEQNAAFEEEYNSKRAYLDLMIKGDSELLTEAIDNWISSCELPVEIGINYEWQEDAGVLLLDVDLPEIEDLPPTELVRQENGNVKEKSKTQKQLRDEYATLVFGLAVFITSNMFNISPAISKILLSGYTQRRDKTGNLVDDYIYSIRFQREMFEKKDFTGNDPLEVCMAAENRCNTTTTLLFKTIQPYDSF